MDKQNVKIRLQTDDQITDGRCPFFVGETRKKIICEGVISRTIFNDFEEKEAKDAHYAQFCCDCGHKKCAIYNALLGVYDDIF